MFISPAVNFLLLFVNKPFVSKAEFSAVVNLTGGTQLLACSAAVVYCQYMILFVFEGTRRQALLSGLIIINIVPGESCKPSALLPDCAGVL